MVYRTAIGVYVLLVLGLAGASFWVSGIDVRGAIYLRGHDQMETGRTNGLRGVFHYAPTGEALDPAHMEWTLESVDDGARYPLSFEQGSAAALWPDLPISLPDEVAPGAYWLEVQTSHEKVSQLTARTEVDVTRRPSPAAQVGDMGWPEAAPRDDDAHRRYPRLVELSEPSDIQVAITPADGELVRAVPGRVYFRVFDKDRGAPVPAAIELELTSGHAIDDIPARIRTDSSGIAVLDVTPAMDLEFDVIVHPTGGADELPRYHLRLYTVGAQYGIRPHQRIIRRGSPVEATIFCAMGNCDYLVDLYDESRLLETLTLSMRDGRGGARFELAEDARISPILRLQAYQSIYGTTHGWDSTYVIFVSDDRPATLLETTRELYSWIADETGSIHHRALVEDGYLSDDLSVIELRRLLEAGLEEIPRSFEQPPVLMNTRMSDREAMQTWRDEVRGDLMIMMSFILFLGVIVVFYLVLLGIRRHRREAMMLAMVDLEFDEPDSAENLRAIQMERITVAVQGAIVLLTILAFALGILLVVSYL